MSCITKKIKSLCVNRFLVRTILTVLMSGSLVSLVSCSQDNTISDNNNNLSAKIVIEPAAPIPVLDGKATATGIYIRNTSDEEVSGISYSVIDENTNQAHVTLSQGSCNKIAANSSCLLSITTPSLSLGDSGSSLIMAEYDNKQDKQLISYSYLDSKSYNGVNFSDGSQAIYGGNGYVTSYVFVGNGQAQSDIGFLSSNNSVSVSNGLTNGKLDLSVNQVVALELKSNENFTSREVLITPYKVTTSRQLHQNLQLGLEANGVLQVVILPTQQANLLMSNIPILTKSEPTSILTIVNNGNQTATGISLTSDSSDVTVEAAPTNSCGASLVVGGSCNYKISLNNQDSNGSALLTLGYNNSLTTTSVVQVVYYHNNKTEPMVKLMPTQSQYVAQNGSSTGYVIFNIMNLGNESLNNVLIASNNNLKHTTIGSQNNTCSNTLAGLGTCSIELLVKPSLALDSGVAYLNLTGNTTKNYSFISMPVHVNIIDTVAPSVVSTSPENTATAVSTSTGITVNFSEPMTATTLNSNNIWLQKESDIVPLSFLSVTNNNKSVTFVLGTRLDYLSSYKVMINPSQIMDENGNAINSNIEESSVATFSTAYDAIPTIVGFTPDNGSSNVNQTPAMQITFSETMIESNINAANIMLKDQNGSTVSGYTVKYNESSLTAVLFLNNDVNLNAESTYGVYVNQQNLKNLVNNAMGVNSNYLVTQFTTGDYIKPELISMATIPTNGSAGIISSTSISLTFTKMMDTSTLNTSTITLIRKINNTQVTLNNPVFSDGDKTVTFKPQSALINTESYTIVVNPSQITDASINHNKLGDDSSRIVSAFSVLGQWTWMGGASTVNAAPVYGTKGVANSANNPGAISYGTTWTESSGNMWLFGGNSLWGGNDATVASNNLWKYNPTTSQWTWMTGPGTYGGIGVYGTKGTAAAANTPGQRRGAVSWIDGSGNLWLFGGYGLATASGTVGYLNDLWKYNPSTNQWTWVSGSNTLSAAATYGTKGTAAPANTPGARWASVTWTDSAGNLWLFGGFGYAASGSSNGFLNDLWRYNPTTNQWTWMNGVNNINYGDNYGTKGVEAANQGPGSREKATSWKDSSGNMWLFGGNGYGAHNSSITMMNDLWRYNPTTNQWTWMNGRNVGNANGVYGTQNQPSINNYPGGRRASVPNGWVDSSGNMWLYGGVGYYGSTSNTGRLADLWKYNPTTNQWTWVNGVNGINWTGVYGTKGVSSMNNRVGSREAPGGGWMDSSGNLWLYGGAGYASTSTFGTLGDMWRFTP